MLSLETDAKLCRLMMNIAEGEKTIELSRQMLAEEPLFETYAAFKRLDDDSKGFINSLDLKKFMCENGVYANEIDCFYLLKLFDSESSGMLSYRDFLQMILPTANSKLRQLVTQRPNYVMQKGERLAPGVEVAMTKLYHNELALHRKIEKGKHHLSFRYDFNLKDAFQSIAQNDKFITFQNLKPFLRKNGFLAWSEDLVAFIRRLDKNGDAQLSFEEFEEGIVPVEKPPPSHKKTTFCYGYPDLPSHLYIKTHGYRASSPLKKPRSAAKSRRTKTSDGTNLSKLSPLKTYESQLAKKQKLVPSKKLYFESPVRHHLLKKVKKPLKDEKEGKMGEHSIPIGN